MNNPMLTSLSGLQNIESVWLLYVGSNDVLTNLSGLDNISSVVYGIIICENPMLNNILPLSGLESSALCHFNP